MKAKERLAIAATGFLMASLAAVPAHAEYVLRAGDVLGISVIGDEGQQKRVMIDTDGRVYLSFIGEVTAEGKTISDLRKEVISRYSDVTYRVDSRTSGASLRTFPAGSVLIEVVEYRPLYILGDVSRPGEIVFRPGITVLQAIANAGGSLRFAAGREDAESSAIKLQTRVAVLREQINQSRALIARLREDLANLSADKPPVDSSADATVGEMAVSDEASRDSVDARQKARSLAHQQTMATIEQMRRRLEILQKQEEGAQQAVDLDIDHLSRFEKLERSGNVTAKSLLDARRTLLFSSSRALEISAERGNLEVELTRLILSVGVEDQLETARILEQVESSESDLRVGMAELHGTLSQMAFLGYAPSEVLGPPEIVVIRDGLDGSTEIAATPDMKLQPGDVIKVTMSLILDDTDDVVRSQ